MPAGCTVPTQTTACVKVWASNTVDQGHFPDGNIFSCNNPATPHVIAPTSQDVANKFTGLGKNGGTASYTPIKSTFTKENANLFIFKLGSDYSTAFTAANQPFGNPAGAAALTYPNDTVTTIWYTALFETTIGGTSSTLTWVGTHELGHTFDDNHAPQPSSLASYDLAMQHDWLTLDYVSYPSTLRLPCATAPYTGPLVGVIDKTTGANFCSGGVLVAGSSWAAGKKVSEIIRDPSQWGNANNAAVYQPNSVTVGNSYTNVPGWREWHSEAFAIAASVDVVSTQYWQIYRQVWLNGYYACTAKSGASGWAYTEYTTGEAVVTPPCQTAMPVGWVVIH